MKFKKYISAIFTALFCFCATSAAAFADTAENASKAPFNVGRSILIAVVAGVVIALIVTLTMKSRLKTVRPNNSAREFIKKGSLDLRVNRDTFLYRRVERTAKQQDTQR